MRNLLSRLRQAPKHVSALVAVIAAVLVIPAALHAWGPERQTFTIENPAPYVEFNSITNNPNIGDERNFVGIRENGTNGLWQDNVKVQPGKEYVVRMYVHNNAAENLNLMARDVNAMFYLPNTSAKSHQVNGFLRSSNAKTKEVYDHATFTADQDFKLAYINGSAKYYNNANGNGFTIPESLFTASGAKLGYDKMDGNIPGCFQYAGYLTFIVRPQFPEVPKDDFTVSKDVRKVGGKFAESVKVEPGETVNYRIQFKNTGNSQLNNVILKDKLPKGVTFVPGTVKIMNASNPGGAFIKDGDKLFSTGVNIGSYTAGSNALIVFDAKIGVKTELECSAKTLKNIASAQPEGLQPKEDDADVTTDIECPQPKEITVCRLGDKKYPVTIKEEDFDPAKHSMNPEDCKEEPTPEPEKIKVCELATKKYPVIINKDDFDSNKHSMNPEDCKEEPTPEPEKIKVCELATKKYPVIINKDDFDSNKHSMNPEDCKEVPVTPPELPQTGGTDGILNALGLGALVTTTLAYVASRRNSLIG